MSRRCVTLLLERGIGKGDHVALVSGNSAAFLVAWFRHQRGRRGCGVPERPANGRQHPTTWWRNPIQADPLADGAWVEDSSALILVKLGPSFPLSRSTDGGHPQRSWPIFQRARSRLSRRTGILHHSLHVWNDWTPERRDVRHGGYAATGCAVRAHPQTLTADDRIFVYLHSITPIPRLMRYDVAR